MSLAGSRFSSDSAPRPFHHRHHRVLLTRVAKWSAVAFGAQYEYIKRNAFAGIGGAPSTDNNIVMTSVRYYPF